MTNIFDAFKKGDQHLALHSGYSISFAVEKCLCQIKFWTFILGITAGIALIFSPNVGAATQPVKAKDVVTLIADLKEKFKERKFNWDMSLFSSVGWETHGTTVNGYPLIYYTCGNKNSSNSSLILSTVHGDEVTPVYFGFRLVEWLKARPQLCQNRFIVVAPIVNVDGFLRYTKGTRTNYNKVDLNRNFDTPDWSEKALQIWKAKFKERRYYPGDKAASEPETLFQQWMIEEFKPGKILSIHAPLNFLDYDGPETNDVKELSKVYVDSCEELKTAVKKAASALSFFAYGVFPGSLGNYAGKQRGIPTFTVELPTIKAELAGHYFGDLESGTEVFIQYELKETHAQSMRLQKKKISAASPMVN